MRRRMSEVKAFVLTISGCLRKMVRGDRVGSLEGRRPRAEHLGGESAVVRESPFARAVASLGIAELTFVLAIILYLFVLIRLGRLPQLDGDEISFKSPGREWAASGRFASPELRGWRGLDPPLERIWLIYPPVYPFLFGVFVKVFGFGWRQCEMFDGLIRVALAALTYAVAYRLADR